MHLASFAHFVELSPSTRLSVHGTTRAMKRKKVVVAGIVVLFASLAGVVGWMGPRNVIGMIRYDQREEGRLRAGDAAPDVELFALSGEKREKLSAHVGDKPLVLIFGSFT